MFCSSRSRGFNFTKTIQKLPAPIAHSPLHQHFHCLSRSYQVSCIIIIISYSHLLRFVRKLDIYMMQSISTLTLSFTACWTARTRETALKSLMRFEGEVILALWGKSIFQSARKLRLHCKTLINRRQESVLITQIPNLIISSSHFSFIFIQFRTKSFLVHVDENGDAAGNYTILGVKSINDAVDYNNSSFGLFPFGTFITKTMNVELVGASAAAGVSQTFPVRI